MESHRQLGTWELVPITQLNRTRGDVPLNTKMFGKCKRGPDGNLLPGNKEFKMRCVARGDQAPDWLCPDSSASVPTSTCIHMLNATVCKQDLDYVNYDVRAAFLGCELDNDNTYVRLSKHFRTYRYADGVDRKEPTYNGKQGVELIGWCKKSIYGLPQAMKLYNDEFKRITIESGMIQSEHEPCLYYKYTDRYKYITKYRDDQGQLQQRVEHSTEPERDGVAGEKDTPYQTLICHWVDDVLVASTPGSPDKARFIEALTSRFEITGGDDVTWVLNQEVIRDRAKGTLMLS